jgi:membrane fusion protein (multidrug efflux system)
MTDTRVHPADPGAEPLATAPAPQSGPAAAAEKPTAAAPAPRGNPRARRRWLLVLGAVVVIGLLVWAAMHFLLAKPEEETDDAYVAGDVVAITARDAGQVTAIHADNTQSVKAGQPLIDLDPVTADVGLASAEAELARAVRATKADITRVSQGSAAIIQAQAELARAQDDYRRRRGAAAEGAVSGEELSHAADAVKVAVASLALAREQQAQSRATVQGGNVDTNPAVLAAIAMYRRAAITRSHMHIAAPIDGVVAQRTVQLGQQIAAGTPLMAVVPLDRVWVDANMRETQLKSLRIGQRATVTADMYGDDLVYHGHVIGVGAGSGNAFALLPAQNASGNWIKIVQRVPVRIALDPRELRANPLRVGLSVNAVVDTADTRGARVGSPGKQAYAAQPSDARDPAVEARIRQVIAANR